LACVIIVQTRKLVKITIILGEDFMSNNHERKEEILERSRNAKKDEGAEHAYDKGHRLAYQLVYYMILVISVYAVWVGDMALMFSQGVVLMMGPIGICIERYRFCKSKWAIVVAIPLSLFAIYAAYRVVYHTLGV